MEELKDLLEAHLNRDLLRIIISGQRQTQPVVKIKIRPLEKGGELLFQAASWDGKKEFHKNYRAQELTAAILVWMGRDFKQLQMDTTTGSFHVLVSKKGKVTVHSKTCGEKRARADMAHDRTKQYLLPEGEPVPFLVELGVMTPEGKVVRAKYDKFRQINRFLEFIEDIVRELPQGKELRILDFGCGKSYLTFAVYYYLHEKKGLALNVTGLDLKEDVIAACNALAQTLGYEKLHFQTGDIAAFQENGPGPDLVITLHACDTATDYALAKAVQWRSKVILSVPCCQHELNGQLVCGELEPVLKYGLLRERLAALVTDGLRASMLEEQGYQVQVLEFIDMEHTPKNILIRAVRREHAPEQPKHSEALAECMDFLHVSPTLARILKET